MSKSTKFFIEGEHYLSLGLLTLAREKFEAALELSRQFNEQDGVGVCLFYLAQIAANEKNRSAAMNYLKEARAFYRTRNLPQMLTQLDHLEKAIHAIDENVETKGGEAPLTRQDPFELWRNGDLEQAIKIFSHDVQQFEKNKNQLYCGMSLIYLGQAEFANGQTKAALEHLNQARAIADELQNKSLQNALNNAYKTIDFVESQPEINHKSLEQLMDSVDDPIQKLHLALKKGELLILQGIAREAEVAIHEARKQLPSENPEKYQALIMLHETKLLHLKGKSDQARKVLEAALILARKVNDPTLKVLIEQTLV